jgi:hypothetical protein
MQMDAKGVSPFIQGLGAAHAALSENDSGAGFLARGSQLEFQPFAPGQPVWRVDAEPAPAHVVYGARAQHATRRRTEQRFPLHLAPGPSAPFRTMGYAPVRPKVNVPAAQRSV